jgi:hypothetical protein
MRSAKMLVIMVVGMIVSLAVVGKAIYLSGSADG